MKKNLLHSFKGLTHFIGGKSKIPGQILAPFFSLVFILLSSSFLQAQSFEEAAGLDYGYSHPQGAFWGDYDMDGDLDLVLLSSSSKIYRNDDGIFTAVANLFNLYSNVAGAWGDYDNDGDLDLVISGTSSNITYTIIYRNDNGTFVDIEAGLVGTRSASLAWGDDDGDGDLDLLVVGDLEYQSPVSKIYRNNDGAFVDIGADLETGYNSQASWIDYDNDGDLDLFWKGFSEGNRSVLYENREGIYRKVDTNLPTWSYGSFAWGDFDNNGWPDLLFSGQTQNRYQTKIYQNNQGAFTEFEAVLPDISDGTVAWVDYNNDDLLDFILRGNTTDGTLTTQLFKNENGSFVLDETANLPGLGTKVLAWGDYTNDGKADLILDGKLFKNQTANAPKTPGTPLNLQSGFAKGRLNLQWDKADAQENVSFNIRVGTTPGGSEIVSAMSSQADGFRSIPAIGNTGHAQNTLIKNLQAGTYYWTVQAVSKTFTGSSFHEEQQITVPDYPASPDNLVADPFMEEVILGWSPVATANLSHYKIYRETTLVGTPTNLIFSSEGNAQQLTEYLDENLTPETAYYYYLAVVDNNGTESDYTLAETRTSILKEKKDTGIEALYFGCSAWGDYDNDGDLDLIISGRALDQSAKTILYRNDDGVFTDTQFAFPGTIRGSVAWGDYNSDGLLDIALSGSGISKVFENTGNGFIDTEADLPALTGSFLYWGDHDSDGDLDLILSGKTATGYSKLLIYKNNNGVLTNSNLDIRGADGSLDVGDSNNNGFLNFLVYGTSYTGYGGGPYYDIISTRTGESYWSYSLPDRIAEGGASFTDFDNDGYLDLMASGQLDRVATSILYRNDQTGKFTATDLKIEGLLNPKMNWGDLDNDGDLDLFISGKNSSNSNYTKIYRNDGDQFVDLNIIISGNFQSISLADFNNDQTIDLFVMGKHAGVPYAKLYENISDNAATPPEVPTGLKVESKNGGILLSWDRPENAPYLSYNVKMGSNPDAFDVVHPAADLETGFSKVMTRGNSGVKNSYFIKGLAIDKPYYWSVQAINGANTASPFSVENSFTIPNPIQQVSASVADRKVMLEWDEITMADFSHYNIYRDIYDRQVPTNLIFSSEAGIPSSTSFEDKDRENHKTYYYYLTAVNTAGIESPYLKTSATPKAFELVEDIAFPNMRHGQFAWGDYDNDGDLDLLISGSQEEELFSRIYKNENGTFTDIEAGLIPLMGSAVDWGDFDNDGDLDLVIMGRDEGMLRYTRIYRNDNGTFTDLEAGLEGMQSGAVKWGDYDNDGDLDLLQTGNASGSNIICKVYNNDHGIFSDSGIELPGVELGSANWVDYNNDGNPDIFLSGRGRWGTLSSTLYTNTGEGEFTPSAAEFPGVSYGASAWGDFDNDGDMDLLLSGKGSDRDLSRVYRNDNGSFTAPLYYLKALNESSLAWGDYDNDGLLDILLTGQDAAYNRYVIVYRNNGNGFSDANHQLGLVESSRVSGWVDYNNDGRLDILEAGANIGGWNLDQKTWLYRNLTEKANSLPEAPVALQSTNTRRGMKLEWTAPTDAEGGSLSYNVRVGTQPGADDVVNAMADLSTGFRKVQSPGNAGMVQHYTLSNLQEQTYYWSVQAIDGGGKASAFAVEGSFEYQDLLFGPTSFVAQQEDRNIRLSWDAFEGQDFLHYQLYREETAKEVPENLIFTSEEGNAANASFTDAELRKNTDYYYYVKIVTQTEEGFFSELTVSIDYPFEGPGNLLAEIVGNKVALSWDPYEFKDFAAYKIYREDSDTETPQQLLYTSNENSAGNSTFEDSELLRGNEYFYFVSVRNSYGEESTFSKVSIVADIPFPGPDQVQLTPGNTEMLVQWRQYNSNVFHHYKVYRETEEKDIPSNLVFASQQGNAADTSFRDTGLQNYQTYFYYVSVIDLSGKESLFSVAAEEPVLFTEINPALENSQLGAVWADYDNDQDLDVFVQGTAGSQATSSGKIYKNDQGSYIDIGLHIEAYCENPVWADFDNDGRLDLLLNATLFKNNGSGFEKIQLELDEPVDVFNASWGDYDNDGDLDLALPGAKDQPISRIYRNDNGTLVNINAELPQLSNGKISWADFDNDGQLDFAMMGVSKDGLPNSFIYKNVGSSFDLFQTLEGNYGGDFSWSDYNNDGKLDLLETGILAGYVYRNDGNEFTKVFTISEDKGFSSGSWMDLNNDGDADFIIVGKEIGKPLVYFNESNGFVKTNIKLGVENSSIISAGDFDKDGRIDLLLADGEGTKIFKNLSIVKSSRPAQVENTATVQEEKEVRFSWSPVEEHGSTYNLRIGTVPGASDVLNAASDLATGLRQLASLGNMQLNTSYTTAGLPSGIYYWSVQAVNHAFVGGPFSQEKVLVVSEDGAIEVEAYLKEEEQFKLSDYFLNPDNEKIEFTVEASEQTDILTHSLQENVLTVNYQKEGKTSLKVTAHYENAASNILLFNFTVSSPTGLKDASNGLNNPVLLYPNPTSGMVQVRLKDMSFTKAELRVTTLLGQPLLSQKFSSEAGQNEIKFDISSFPTGNYVVIIKTPQHTWNFRVLKK